MVVQLFVHTWNCTYISYLDAKPHNYKEEGKTANKFLFIYYFCRRFYGLSKCPLYLFLTYYMLYCEIVSMILLPFGYIGDLWWLVAWSFKAIYCLHLQRVAHISFCSHCMVEHIAHIDLDSSFIVSPESLSKCI